MLSNQILHKTAQDIREITGFDCAIWDMHGGTISVASDLNGTVFTVKLQVRFDVNKENFGNIEDEKQ